MIRLNNIDNSKQKICLDEIKTSMDYIIDFRKFVDLILDEEKSYHIISRLIYIDENEHTSFSSEYVNTDISYMSDYCDSCSFEDDDIRIVRTPSQHSIIMKTEIDENSFIEGSTMFNGIIYDIIDDSTNLSVGIMSKLMELEYINQKKKYGIMHSMIIPKIPKNSEKLNIDINNK